MRALSALLVMAALGLLLGGLLALAARILGVRGPSVAQDVEALLPGANCGACGFAGCAALAEALAAGRAPPDACPVAGGEAAARIARALGLQPPQRAGPGEAAPTPQERVARLICRGGGERCRRLYRYQGLRQCRAAAAGPGGGERACPWACLGLGDCVRVCPEGAMSLGPDGLPVVDEARCTGCERCVARCPKGALQLQPRRRTVYVLCRNRREAARVRRACRAGCLACRVCEKACPEGAIKVEGNLAVIDYGRCTGCGLCVDKCPVGALSTAG